MRLVVLASGRGSNFLAIAQAVRSGRIPHSEIAGLVSNRADAPALEHAKTLGIPSYLHESRPYVKDKKLDRLAYEAGLVPLVQSLSPDYICLAGYMLMLGPAMIGAFAHRILNIHPSLLPKYKGLHPQRQALAAREKQTGCTVHWVTATLDDGPALRQATIEILPGDTEATLSARLLPLEHATYVEALAELAKHQVDKDRK